ncbi:hypothetical protein Tco_0021612, partial [Tanacetum coccineum]
MISVGVAATWRHLIGQSPLTWQSTSADGTHVLTWQLTWQPRGVHVVLTWLSPKPGTDIANITRKEPKPDKNGHGNGKSAQELE